MLLLLMLTLPVYADWHWCWVWIDITVDDNCPLQNLDPDTLYKYNLRIRRKIIYAGVQPGSCVQYVVWGVLQHFSLGGQEFIFCHLIGYSNVHRYVSFCTLFLLLTEHFYGWSVLMSGACLNVYVTFLFLQCSFKLVFWD